MSRATPRSSRTLESVWNDYKDWDQHSCATQSQVRFWQRLVLGLSVSGAVLGTASGVGGASFDGLECSGVVACLDVVSIGERPFSVLGVLSALLLASAAYLTKEILGGPQQSEWIRTRAAAEALKSAAFLFATGAPPYDSEEAESRLDRRTARITRSVSQIPLVPGGGLNNTEPPPTPGMSAQEYQAQRVESQISRTSGYYWGAVRKNDRLVKRFQRVGLGLAWISALMGVFVASGVSSVAPWVAVVTTVSGTIAAYFQAGRYQDLATSYAATARELEHVVRSWEIADEAGDPEATVARLALEFESIVATENQSWMAQWFEDLDPGPDGRDPESTSAGRAAPA